MNREVAQAIVNSLSSGTVPIQYAHYYTVGRKNQLDIVQNEIANNSSKIRFINGDYGTGKTHFIATIRHWAIKHNYVPSHVILSHRGTPLYDLRSVYSRILKNLVYHEQSDVTTIQAILEFIYQSFQDWVNKLDTAQQKICEKSALAPLYCHHCHKTGKIEELYIKEFRKLNFPLQQAITIYRHARWGWNPDFETADMVIRWIEGEILYRKELNYLGVWENLGEDDILRGLNEVTKLITLVGKKGMVVMFDEAEGIEKLTPVQKPIAYQNLQFLIDGAYKVDNIYFLYANTPTFYNDVESYSENLKEIVRTTACTNLLPLSSNDIITLVSHIAEIFTSSLGESSTSANAHKIASTAKKAIEYYENLYPDSSVSIRKIITDLIAELSALTINNQ